MTEGIDFSIISTILYIVEIFLIMEKKTRPSTEKNIPNTHFKVKFGTVNKKNPEVVYIEAKTFITPSNDEFNYNTTLQKVRREFLFYINELLKHSKCYESKTILDLQVAKNCLIVGKKSFLTFQLLLRQNRNDIKQFKALKNETVEFINLITNTLYNLLIDNEFYVTKSKSSSSLKDKETVDEECVNSYVGI